MKEVVSCAFNIDTASVEVKYADGSMISIYCPAVEDEVAENMYQRSELDWLIYNDPAAYADLILNGDPETYLKSVTENKPLDYRRTASAGTLRCWYWRFFYIFSISANTTAC